METVKSFKTDGTEFEDKEECRKLAVRVSNNESLESQIGKVIWLTQNYGYYGEKAFRIILRAIWTK